MSIAAVLLAAGRSTRFGAADKLQASLDGVPLALHAARTLAALPFAARFVVIGGAALDWPDFRPIVNDRPEAGMARSLALGVAAARAAGADAVLVALADMPFLPATHFARLAALHHGPDSLAASSDGEKRLPPALFGADWFATLEALTGDKGARALLDRAEPVAAPADWLVDIDSVADLASAQSVREGTAGE